MRAPRRVPWATKTELNELYDWLFSPASELSTRKRGLARMSVYISSPSCPAFLHLLYHLVSASLLPAPSSPEESQASRLTCAMAVVRFVNGMVDPLQTGPYARPISHLAATLHIPPNLISLRHRATHEDLPPLPLLQDAVHQAIEYLHAHSFLPLLASGSGSAPEEGWGRRARAEELVKGWKRVMKTRVRDREVGEETPASREIRRLRKELEGEEVGEIAEALCGQEGLVPVGRKKRPTLLKETLPSSTSLQIWTPLIVHLSTLDPSFPSVLADQILTTILITRPQESDGRGGAGQTDTDTDTDVEARRERQKESQSFRWGLATWLIWFWGGSEVSLSLAAEDRIQLWRRLVEALLEGDIVLRRLAAVLAQTDSSLAATYGILEPLLLQTVQPVQTEQSDVVGLSGMELDLPTEDMDVQGRLDTMEERLLAMEKIRARRSSSATVPQQHSMLGNGGDGANAVGVGVGVGVPGWRKLGNTEWRACPIGVWGGV